MNKELARKIRFWNERTNERTNQRRVYFQPYKIPIIERAVLRLDYILEPREVNVEKERKRDSDFDLLSTRKIHIFRASDTPQSTSFQREQIKRKSPPFSLNIFHSHLVTARYTDKTRIEYIGMTSRPFGNWRDYQLPFCYSTILSAEFLCEIHPVDRLLPSVVEPSTKLEIVRPRTFHFRH